MNLVSTLKKDLEKANKKIELKIFNYYTYINFLNLFLFIYYKNK